MSLGGALIIGCSPSGKQTADSGDARLHETKCIEHIIGEKNYHSAVIVKALIQIRSGRQEQAITDLETLLDLNTIYIYENSPVSEATKNGARLIKDCRSKFDQYSAGLATNGNPVLKERNQKAHSFLGL